MKKIYFLITILVIFSTTSFSEIKDSIFATVGNKAITESDIINEIKTILILSNQPYSLDKKDQLQSVAVRETVKRNIKKMEIEKYQSLSYNESDLTKELVKIADQAKIDLETLKIKFQQNGLNFSNVIENIRTELLWNSLIFSLYKDRLIINLDEVNEQLEELNSEKKVNEYLVSEIIIKATQSDQIETEIKKIKEEIEIHGFEEVAMKKSISDTSVNGGNLGWVSENLISKKFKSEIINTPVGNISNPIIIPEGILIFKIRDKKISEKGINLEIAKDQIVAAEKTKLLNMYSLSHYDTLKRSIAINYY